MRKTLFILPFFFWVTNAQKLTPEEKIELQQLALDLANSRVLMALSAHPDDEDGATLAYYRMKYGVKTYSVLLSRGEGGQNEVGPELYKDLGVIRTRETEQAGRILGAEVYFLNFIDFGYSKTATETFRYWGGRKAILERLVYIIRKLKPDVIITNHNPIDGHGHHQAVAIAAIEAFDAAADPTFAPEQLREEGIDLWQPKKLFWRAQRFTGERREPVDVVNHTSARDPLRHRSYQEIALEALSQHKSQGMDKFALRREINPAARTMYRLIRSNSRYENDTTSFFGGIKPLSNQSTLESAARKLEELSRSVLKFSNEGEREPLLDSLRRALLDTSLRRYQDILSALNMKTRSGEYSPLEHRTVKLWNESIERMGALLHGISIKVAASDTIVVPGQQFTVRVVDVSPRKWKGSLNFGIRVPSIWTAEKQDGGFSITLPWSATPTLPLSEGIYRSYQSTPLVTLLAATREQPGFVFEIPVNISVAPRQMLSITPKATRLKEGGNEFQFKVRNYFHNKTAGRIQAELPAGWSVSPSEFIIDKEDGEAVGKVVIFPAQRVRPGDYRVVFRAHDARDTVVIRKFDVGVSREAYVGVVKSYDDVLENALGELGTRFKLLEEKDLAGDLSKFTSIIVDIRGYLVREDLKKNNGRMLDYVKTGGNLIVMYQKDFEWKSEYAPYPLQISRDRLVDEAAPIRVLQPDHPLFNSPNKISAPDWEGWVQERGLYFPDRYSSDYVELLSSNDPDERLLNGGYLFARYGQGTYIYTSYVWYRQWKEAHPGALRNLANMISLPFYLAKR